MNRCGGPRVGTRSGARLRRRDAARRSRRALCGTRSTRSARDSLDAEAARVEDSVKKAQALLPVGGCCASSRSGGEAAKQREAAWLTEPTAPGVYDTLAEHLVAVAPGEAVQARISLYEQAVRATKDPDRRIHLLEKIAWLKDDIAGDTSGAVRAYEEFLAIEPARLSAIMGLASVAMRAGDDRALAKALQSQADVTVERRPRPSCDYVRPRRSHRAILSVRSRSPRSWLTKIRLDDPHGGRPAGDPGGWGVPKTKVRAAEVVTQLHSRRVAGTGRPTCWVAEQRRRRIRHKKSRSSSRRWTFSWGGCARRTGRSKHSPSCPRSSRVILLLAQRR